MKSPSIFGDKRLDKDYLNLIQEMSASGSSVINRACKKSSDKKAAYRFINNYYCPLKHKAVSPTS